MSDGYLMSWFENNRDASGLTFYPSSDSVLIGPFPSSSAAAHKAILIENDQYLDAGNIDSGSYSPHATGGSGQPLFGTFSDVLVEGDGSSVERF